MITQRHTTTNEQKLSRACDVFREVMLQVLTRGFSGTAAVEIAVQDGTIQHIRRSVESIEK
jgi:hypothetical protein